jgi:hypothetical protein
MTPIDFYFDPACPWTWITSRWVVEVSRPRELDITWKTFSLRYRNRENPGYDWIRPKLELQHRAVRVIQATREQFGNEAVGRLYTALGTLIHHDDDIDLDRLPQAIAWAGLPPDIIDAGSDAGWDQSIVDSTDEGWRLVGDDGGIPLIVVPDRPATFFGPVLSPAPTGEDALALWDAFVVLGRFDGLYEIKRTRKVKPIFGPRPSP